jgi:hypothetical protein
MWLSAPFGVMAIFPSKGQAFETTLTIFEIDLYRLCRRAGGSKDTGLSDQLDVWVRDLRVAPSPEAKGKIRLLADVGVCFW